MAELPAMDVTAPAPGPAGSAESLERFCTALLAVLRAGPLEAGVAAELARVIGDGVGRLGAELRRELGLIDEAAARVADLERARLLDGRLIDDFRGELSRKRASLIALLTAFEQLDSPGPPPAAADAERSPVQFDASPQSPVPAADPEPESAGLVELFPNNGASVETALHDRASAETLTMPRYEATVGDEASARCREADALRRRGDYVRAEELYIEAIELAPDWPVSHAKRGLLYLLAGENGYAVEDFTAALGLGGENAELFALRGDAHARDGRLTEAVEDYRRALQIEADFHKARFNMGLALRRLGAWSGALSAFTRVIGACPDHAPAHYHRGLVRLEHGTLQEAIADFRAAVRCRPDYAEARARLEAAVAKARAIAGAAPVTDPPPAEGPAPSPSDKPARVPVQCPGCGTTGLLNWNRLDKVVICQECRRSFGVRPDGRAVEVVRTGDGRWVELAATLAQQSRKRRRRLGWAAVAALVLIPVAGLTVWKAARPPHQAAAAELPKDLNGRVEVFARAWLRNDVPMMRRLTSPAHEKILYAWYNRKRPPIPAAEGIRKSLPEEIRVRVDVPSGTSKGASRAVVRVEGLESMGGPTTPVELALDWQELDGVWYFRPPVRR